MGCCERKRQKPVEEERDIPLEEALEKVNKLHEQLQKEYGDGKLEKLETSKIIIIQEVLNSLILFTTVLENKLIDPPTEMPEKDINSIYYYCTEIEMLKKEDVINYEFIKEANSSIEGLNKRLQTQSNSSQGKRD